MRYRSKRKNYPDQNSYYEQESLGETVWLDDWLDKDTAKRIRESRTVYEKQVPVARELGLRAAILGGTTLAVVALDMALVLTTHGTSARDAELGLSGLTAAGAAMTGRTIGRRINSHDIMRQSLENGEWEFLHHRAPLSEVDWIAQALPAAQAERLRTRALRVPVEIPSNMSPTDTHPSESGSWIALPNPDKS
jgi:hypothetical protein